MSAYSSFLLLSLSITEICCWLRRFSFVRFLIRCKHIIIDTGNRMNKYDRLRSKHSRTTLRAKKWIHWNESPQEKNENSFVEDIGGISAKRELGLKIFLQKYFKEMLKWNCNRLKICLHFDRTTYCANAHFLLSTYHMCNYIYIYEHSVHLYAKTNAQILIHTRKQKLNHFRVCARALAPRNTRYHDVVVVVAVVGKIGNHFKMK